MIRLSLLLVCGLLLTQPAFAGTIEIDRAACKLLSAHHPLPDVTYNPSVDVHGNTVASADLNPGPKVGDRFTIPVTVDIGTQFGIPLNAATGSKATVAMVTVDGNKVYLDGQPLTHEQEENLAVLCIENRQ